MAVWFGVSGLCPSSTRIIRLRDRLRRRRRLTTICDGLDKPAPNSLCESAETLFNEIKGDYEAQKVDDGEEDLKPLRKRESASDDVL